MEVGVAIISGLKFGKLRPTFTGKSLIGCPRTIGVWGGGGGRGGTAPPPPPKYFLPM